MKLFNITPGHDISGEIRVASDKSITHRALLLSALCTEPTEIISPLLSEDTYATINAVRACGIEITQEEGKELVVKGGVLSAPNGTIDCGNSGTLIRLFCGIAVGRNLSCKLVGDASLMQRPMKRITEPLQEMGAVINSEKGKPPIVLGERSEALRGIMHSNIVNSAQVKTSLLLAGLYAEGNTIIAEPIPSRDHGELMLIEFGAKLSRSKDGRIVQINSGELTSPGNIAVPADISSAVFFIVAAAIAPAGEITLKEVGINSSRTGALDILLQMGADIDILNRRTMGNEPVADICVRSSQLHGIKIGAEMIPSAIDDIPALLIAAAAARGETHITGAGELRHKESDRISSMVTGLQELGINCTELPDGVIVQGKNSGKPIFNSGTVNSEGDHRIAMAFAMASVRAKGNITISDTANVNTSFPNFTKLSNSVGIRIVEESDDDA
ncbi:MAG: 3-phosphoshikimate 1-carboxyvinyltransferase [Proteobacteria bacterium]|nr:3-phosphoshikimate 1-carboxyvinyltransferase [Pseudomonadota bacterium]MCH9758172.1 3-phosphoshikimate 1-carboxyvinyltransferase [Pseudomonadota bacterium]